MKLRRVASPLFAVALFFAAVSHGEELMGNGWYVTAEGAPSWMGGLTAQANGAIAASQHQSFKIGARLSTAVGYRFNEWFAGELETGYIYNKFWDANSSGDKARLHRIPLMFNAVAEWRNETVFTPYFGLGVGFMTSFFDGNYDIGPTRLTGSDVSLNFAYQGFAGVRTMLCECVELNLSYKLTGTMGPDFQLGSPLGRTQLRLGDTLTHSISLGMSYNF